MALLFVQLRLILVQGNPREQVPTTPIFLARREVSPHRAAIVRDAVVYPRNGCFEGLHYTLLVRWVNRALPGHLLEGGQRRLREA